MTDQGTEAKKSKPKQKPADIIEGYSNRHREVIDKRCGLAPLKYRKGYLRAAAGLGGRANAIRVFCLECVGWASKEVANCSAYGCPLYAFRPKMKG